MGYITSFCLGVVVGVAWALVDENTTYSPSSLLQECRAELPRNLDCELVVEAKVKENNK